MPSARELLEQVDALMRRNRGVTSARDAAPSRPAPPGISSARGVPLDALLDRHSTHDSLEADFDRDLAAAAQSAAVPVGLEHAGDRDAATASARGGEPAQAEAKPVFAPPVFAPIDLDAELDSGLDGRDEALEAALETGLDARADEAVHEMPPAPVSKREPEPATEPWVRADATSLRAPEEPVGDAATTTASSASPATALPFEDVPELTEVADEVALPNTIAGMPVAGDATADRDLQARAALDDVPELTDVIDDLRVVDGAEFAEGESVAEPRREPIAARPETAAIAHEAVVEHEATAVESEATAIAHEAVVEHEPTAVESEATAIAHEAVVEHEATAVEHEATAVESEATAIAHEAVVEHEPTAVEHEATAIAHDEGVEHEATALEREPVDGDREAADHATETAATSPAPTAAAPALEPTTLPAEAIVPNEAIADAGRVATRTAGALPPSVIEWAALFTHHGAPLAPRLSEPVFEGSIAPSTTAPMPPTQHAEGGSHATDAQSAPAKPVHPAPAHAPAPTVTPSLAAAVAARAAQAAMQAQQPALPATPAPSEDERWRALGEDIRMQVLQRIDIFTDTGLQAKLKERLQPIVDRASAELVDTINRQVGQVMREYVAEAVEREIERWRSTGP